MAAPKPREARCGRCKQTRPVFVYKPLHDCVEEAGTVDLAEAAVWLGWFEQYDDRWCQARVNRRPQRLCVPCHDREAKSEQRFIDEVLDLFLT
ncbi:hypothetical protein [Streptomyces sp. NPDC046685]|uniref:hypothetical protein n=1 Tax=Streptomyces sp. NPDC046685 TaxID=3157202 RepID=UPI003402070B